MRIFCVRFPREREEREFFQNFLNFSDFSALFFSLFLYFFSIKNSIFFFLKNKGRIYRGRWKIYQDTLVLAAHSKGQLALVYPETPMLASHFYYLISLFSFFFFLKIWPDFRTAVWRPFRALFPSNFIFTKRSRCIISNSPSLARFGAMVIKISRSEGR